MSETDHFRINSPQVASEILDGDAVIINFDSGCYYSATGAGAEIVASILKNESIAEMRDYLTSRYEAPPDEVLASVQTFLQVMQAENLILPVQSGPAPAAVSRPPLIANEPRRAFTPPVLERFNDLQDLLLLDPIHDVDETGWPVEAKQPA